MLELLKKRRSIRVFTEEPVSREQRDHLLRAGLLAPSSRNRKPVELLVIEDQAVIRRLQGYKDRGTQPLGTATLAILVMGDTRRSDVWVEDASIAATLIHLEAEALGLGSTWIQLRLRQSPDEPSPTAYRREFGIPEHYGILCVLAIGHKGEFKQAHTDADADMSRVYSGRFGEKRGSA